MTAPVRVQAHRQPPVRLVETGQGPDDVNGMPVAVVAVVLALGTAGGVGWLWLMHWAGSTGGMTTYRTIEGLTR